MMHRSSRIIRLLIPYKQKLCESRPLHTGILVSKSNRFTKRSLFSNGFFEQHTENNIVTTARALLSTLSQDKIISSPLPDVTIPVATIPQYVRKHWQEYGDSVALVDGVSGNSYTFNQLSTLIKSTGSALVKMGLKPGDVVILHTTNCIEYPILYLAILEIGAVVSPVNPVYTADELEHALQASEAKAIVTTESVGAVAEQAINQLKDKTGKTVEGIVLGELDGFVSFSQLAKDDGTAYPQDITISHKEDLAVLPYSSGTTGLPKGVMLTHYSIVANLCQLNTREILHYDKNKDTLLGLMPFFHIYGQVGVMLLGMREGVKIVIMQKFDPELYMSLLEKHKVTVAHIAPPIAVFMRSHPMVDNYNLEHLELLICAAAPLGIDLTVELLQRLNLPNLFIRQAYGLTELSPASHCVPTNKIKYGSIGVAIPNTEYKIIDTESGELLGVGETGELCIRGPQMMKGYFNNKEATDTTIIDGWLHTGDIGTYDEEGFVWISDRLKELIKVKGFQVAPAELESLLLTHPGISDAAVIGIPDDRSGELPRAYVVLKSDAKLSETEIQEFVKENVSSYKQLAGGVEIRKEIPKSASGKILRRYLKQEYMEK